MSTGPFEVHKVMDFGHTLIAAAGDGCFATHFPRAVGKKDKKTPTSLRRFLSDYLFQTKPSCELLLINTDGDLINLDMSGADDPLKKTQDFWCVGSGTRYCLGWLEASKSYGVGITPEVATAAIRYTSTVEMGVNDEVEVGFLPALKGLKKKRNVSRK